MELDGMAVSVFTEEDALDLTSASALDLKRLVQAARLVDCETYRIPSDFTESQGAVNALCYLRDQPPGCIGVWAGFIPSAERYAEFYAAARQRNVRLVNSPEEHLRATEFDRSYPLLEDITPRSVTVARFSDCARAEAEIGFPMFVKGAVKSRKEAGWHACVAADRAALEALCADLFGRGSAARGKLIARQLARCDPSALLPTVSRWVVSFAFSSTARPSLGAGAIGTRRVR